MDSDSENSISRGKVKCLVCIVKATLQWILPPKLASLRGKVKWIVCIYTGILKWLCTPKIACFRGKVQGRVASMKPLKRLPQNVTQHHAEKAHIFICNCFMPGSSGNLLYLFDIGPGSLSRQPRALQRRVVITETFARKNGPTVHVVRCVGACRSPV